MPGPDKPLFRKEALDYAHSPDNLERLMPVTGPVDWLLIALAAALAAMVIGWSITGRIPTIASARGVVLRPRQVMQAQVSGAGRILTLRVRAGDRIREGEVIATIDQSSLAKRMEEDRRNLAQLEEQDQRKTAAERSHTALQAQQDSGERAGLESQRATLRKSIEIATHLKPVLESHAQSNRNMVKAGLLGYAVQEVVDSEQAVSDNEAKINDYNSRLSQIDGQLKQIETRSAALERSILDESVSRRNEMEQLRRNIEINDFQIRQDGNVLAQYTGRVSEVMAAAGQVMPAGGRLLTVEADDADESLISISYFPVRDGKKIRPGMRIQLTPDTVERERYGGILGEVISVSPIPVTREGAVGVIGNAELVQTLMPDGAYIEVRARLQRDPRSASGYHWSSSRGPDIRLTSGLTETTRVPIEGRAPVTYLLPILRETAGIY